MLLERCELRLLKNFSFSSHTTIHFFFFLHLFFLPPLFFRALFKKFLKSRNLGLLFYILSFFGRLLTLVTSVTSVTSVDFDHFDRFDRFDKKNTPSSRHQLRFFFL